MALVDIHESQKFDPELISAVATVCPKQDQNCWFFMYAVTQEAQQSDACPKNENGDFIMCIRFMAEMGLLPPYADCKKYKCEVPGPIDRRETDWIAEKNRAAKQYPSE